MVIKNPKCSNKSPRWISLATTNALLLIVAMVLAVAGTNLIRSFVHSSPTGFGIAAAYAQASNTITTATNSISSVNTLSFSIPVNITQPKQMSNCS
jgi:uncharacterized membrane protein